MIFKILENDFFKTIILIILVLLAFIFIKALIEEVARYGIKGLFIAFPKALLKVLTALPRFVLYILKLILNFVKSFIKALKICIRGV